MIGAWFFAAAILLIVLADLALKLSGRPTISAGLRRLSYGPLGPAGGAHPAVPFALGVITGMLIVHLFMIEF